MPQPDDTGMAGASTAGTITSIDVQARNPRRVNVFLDGTYAFALSMEVATQANLKRGMALSDQNIASLVAEDTWQKTYDAALNFLSYRPRSEDEVRRYLIRRKVPPDLSTRVLARLRDGRLIDDEEFTRFWVENRETFSPRGSRALRSELRSKGIDDSTIAAHVSGDDSEAAYQAAQKKARTLVTADRETFRRKLFSFLQRRGFGYDITRETVERVWKERPDQTTGES
jgi:regulatory protein